MFIRSTPLFVAMLCISAASSARAKPVTFVFEATVDVIQQNDWTDQGFDIDVGSVVSGQFTFEPDDGGDCNTAIKYSVTQPYRASLQFNGLNLTTADEAPGIFFRAFDDKFVICDCTIDYFSPPHDTLEVWSSITAVEPFEFASLSANHSYWSFAAADGPELVSPNMTPDHAGGSSWNSPTIPADVGVWNGLNYSRRLTLKLRDESKAGIFVYANVGDFQVVPEPAGILQAIATFFVLVAVVIRKRTKTLEQRLRS